MSLWTGSDELTVKSCVMPLRRPNCDPKIAWHFAECIYKCVFITTTIAVVKQCIDQSWWMNPLDYFYVNWYTLQIFMNWKSGDFELLTKVTCKKNFPRKFHFLRLWWLMVSSVGWLIQLLPCFWSVYITHEKEDS